MGDVYVLILVALAVLAVVDLIVGVSNDAVNFLNSAIGSKAISVRNIMIIASVGVFMGAVTSSGMMEVARKGIFNPGMFVFQDIMIIFMAVMITDILLLGIFNSLGMPTSTTVSIVFELLGASVAIALIKISGNNSETILDIWNYINYEKALEIIKYILISVVVAFTVGAIVQYVSRLIYSFNFERKPSYVNALFGGFAITAITYFIIIKGMKGTPYYKNIKHLIEGNSVLIVLGSFIIWTLLSQLLTKYFKVNILKVIIGIGTFSLAMAFSGNDLVNFIGVPIAAWNSYQAFSEANLATGVSADAFSMGILAKKVPSNIWLLLLAGGIMVVTLWTSQKAKDVVETGINLSRQDEGREKFKSNSLSRFIVKISINLNMGVNYLLPKKVLAFVDSRFQKQVIQLSKDKNFELPAFDLIRAAINLVVAGVLISIATSMKLPLSTTYVTFMVAMGTSLADKAWGSESAVYRVAGVLNIIGGWFLTAIIAFIAAAVIAYLISWTMLMIPVLLVVLILLIVKSTLNSRQKLKEEKEKTIRNKTKLVTLNGVVEQSVSNIAEIANRVNKLYTNVVNDLVNNDINKLRKTDKHIGKLNNEINELKNDVFYFIKSLDDSSVEASRFYIIILRYLQDVGQSINFISRESYKHLSNNHKNLKKGQLKDLKHIDNKLNDLLNNLSFIFENDEIEDLALILVEKQNLLNEVSTYIDKQIVRIRQNGSSPKNSILYFSILLETKDLILALMGLLETYNRFDLKK
jgi:phosphate/sulfate permease